MLRKIYIVMLCLHRQTDIRMLLQLRPELLQITLIHNVSRRRILIHERTIPPFARQPPVHIEPSQIGDRGYLYPSIASCCHFIGNAEYRISILYIMLSHPFLIGPSRRTGTR